MSTRQQLRLLVGVSLAGLGTVAAVSVGVVLLIRGDIVKLSEKTTPLQVNLAKLQRTFEHLSGNFARISMVNSEQDLREIQEDTRAALGDVEMITKTLGDRSSALETMRSTNEELRTMAEERMDSRLRIARAYQEVAGKIESVTGITRELSSQMSDLQNRIYELLAQSKKGSQDANGAIKSMLVLRERTTQIQADLQEVRAVDRKFRLNVLKDKVTGELDTMKSQEIQDKELHEQVRNFIARFGPAFQGDNGLLAARASCLAAPQDAKAAEAFEEKFKALTAMIKALASKLLEEVDAGEFAVQKANSGMNQATDLMGKIGTISGVTAEVSARARTVQALAWQLLASTERGGVERARKDIGTQAEEAGNESRADPAGPRWRPGSKGSKESGRRSPGLPSGAGKILDGAAVAVEQSLDEQARAERLFTKASLAVRRTAARRVGPRARRRIRAGCSGRAHSESIERHPWWWLSRRSSRCSLAPSLRAGFKRRFSRLKQPRRAPARNCAA